ncbi:MAG: hypothetical protein V4487_06545 [Chlamydiota bacterium]
MNSKRIFGILLLIGGIALFLFSNYISKQVTAGKAEISSAQSQVDQSNSLFSLNPVSKEVGKGLTGSAQRKIDAGNQEVNEYERLAGWLKIGGGILLIVGIGFLILGKKK